MIGDTIKIICDVIIIIGIICNMAYTKRLEQNLDALKEWIELFWKIDFDAMSNAVEKHRKRSE